MKRPLRLLLSLLCALFMTTIAWSQYGSSVEGTVVDQSGAAVPNAAVTATNQATGVTRSTTSNSSGFYHIAGLPPGNYTVTGSAATFKQQSMPGVVVAAEAVRGLNLSLQPGPAEQSVTVTAGSELLQTENASISGTVSSQQVVNLPEFGRDPYQLVRLVPGVFADASRQANGNSLAIPQQVGPGGSNSQIFQTENQVQAIADGQRVSANNYLLDGVSVNSLEWGGAAVVTPNPEAVDQISVESNTYSAQDGRNSGAQVKVISKSGTNNFHGSAFIKFNDRGLNAFNKFEGPTNAPKSLLTCESGTASQFTLFAHQCPGRVDQKYRDFAGSIGGPILKNKLFFFFSYEGVRLSNRVTERSVKLETPQFEQYVVQQNPGSIAARIFSTPGIAPRISTVDAQTDCCSLIPGYGLGKWYVAGNAVGQAIGNGPDGIPDWGLFDLSVPNTSSGNQYNGRLDFAHGNNQFFLSAFVVDLNNYNGGHRPIEDITLQPHNYASTVGWNRTISATMLNEFRANFTRFDFDQRQPIGSTNFGIPEIKLFDFDAGLGDAGTMLGIAQSSTTPGALAQNTFALAETLTWVRNRHALKFGFEGEKDQNNNDQPGAERPQYQFRGLLNLANDACCFFEQVAVDPLGGQLNAQRYLRRSDYGLFVQDDWKIRTNLTLNLGLRWEYISPITEAKNVLSNYQFGSQGFINGVVCAPVAPLTPCHNGNQLYQPTHRDFGPRIGFAWSPYSTQNIVFRGGFGVIFNRNADVVYDNVRQDPPYSALASTCCFFDPGPITGPPPGSNINYAIGANRLATSYPVNPAFSNGVAPDGALCSAPGCATVTPVSLFAALPNEPNPYVYVYSLQMQFEPLKDLVFKLGYQGSRSRKLVRTIDLNRIMPGDTFDGTQDKFQNDGSNGQPCGSSNPTCLAPHPTGNARFNNIFTALPDVNASFDAAVVSVTRRFSHGFSIDGNYTWGHAIDTASYEIGFQQTDPANQAIDKGDSDFDVRHNFSISGTWESPFIGGRNSWLGRAAGGWMFTGILSKHSGFPFSALIGSCNTNADRNGDGYCPDLPFAYNGGVIANPDKQQFINGIFPNPSAEFDTKTLGPGCRCRNIFRGPGYTSFDMTFGKDFALPKLGEASKLVLRANFFNLFNVLNLAPFIPATAPTDIINTGQFGRAPDGLAGRVIELQARVTF